VKIEVDGDDKVTGWMIANVCMDRRCAVFWN
jgi:hypothetical protein